VSISVFDPYAFAFLLPLMMRSASMITLAAAVFVQHAAATSDVRRGGATEALDGAMAAVQGALLLEAALPKSGPAPSKEVQREMDGAGTLGFDSNKILDGAEQELTSARERLNSGSGMAASASGIAAGASMLQAGEAKLIKAQTLANRAKADFLGAADPLGDPPQEPKAWDKVTAMLSRASSKHTALDFQLGDVRKMARSKGVSLLAVPEDGRGPALALKDSYGEARDDDILAFLAKE